MKNTFSAIVFMLSAASIIQAQTTVNYLPSSNIFANPERGFYEYTEARSTNYNTLDSNILSSYRLEHSNDSATYSYYSTLVFRYFFLEDFKMSNISTAYLDSMQVDFDMVRAAGLKIIPRFAYTDMTDSMGCPSDICPPYGDAPKNIVLNHIQQLKPLLQTNADVIAALQMGFIGIWGENYYTDYFGDASMPPGKLLDANWIDRSEVLDSLLRALPNTRMVQVRYPQMKQRYVYGVNAPTSSAPIVLAEAYTGSDKSRIGFHNDCTLASFTDYGTFFDYGNSSTPAVADTANLKPYQADDAMFSVMGGETCSDADYDPQNNCAGSDPLAFGDTEIERMRYSYLNANYNHLVNNDWETDGCMDEIRRRLGYRFELQSGTYSDAVQPGQVIDVDLDIKNVGYTSPYNERSVELILRNTVSGDKWYAKLPADPRYWFAQSAAHSITETLCVPATVPNGTYDLLLNLADPMPSLYPDPDYSMRLANLLPGSADVWESATGYNDLGHTITVNNTATNNSCNGEIEFTAVSVVLPVRMLEFTASSAKSSIYLHWKTATELNNSGFMLQRSTDAEHFTDMHWQQGKGNAQKVTSYNWVDNVVSLGITYYYRLAQKDFDGQITYSSIAVAKIENNAGVKEQLNIYPNPTSNQILVHHPQLSNTSINIRILNSHGQVVIVEQDYANGVDVSSLPAGLYFVSCTIDGHTAVKKIIIE